jgi:hypothetical protein
MMKYQTIILGAGLVLGAGLSFPATGCTADAGLAGIGLLESRYPAAAPLLEARGELVQRGPDHFIFRPRVSRAAAPRTPRASQTTRWRTSVRDSDVSVRVEEGQVELELAAGGKPIRIRRSVPRATRASIDDERAILAVDGGVHTVFVPLERGVEELVVMRDERVVKYDFALPVGWSLREARGYVGVVEVLDDGERAQARMRASLAWDATGDEVPIDVGLARSSVTLTVPDDVPGPVLLDPAWEDGGTVVQVRRNATTALLPSGKVLITGGATAAGGSAVATTELYDPESATFTAGPPMQGAADGTEQPRVHHAAAVLPNGSVLIAGGLVKDLMISQHTSPVSVPAPALSTALVYDTSTNSFLDVGAMNEPRCRFTMTVLGDGRALVAGGTSSGATHSTAEIFDPDTGAFEPVATMSTPRHEHAATLVHDGVTAKVLISGGSDGMSPTATAELFDSSTEQFAPVATDLSTPRFGHTSILLPDGRVLVAGGKDAAPLQDAHYFDPVTSSFSPTPGPMDKPRFRSSSAVMPNGDVVLAGGLNDEDGGTVEFPISSAERFHVASGTFDPLDESPFLTQSPSLHPLPDGSILLTGLTPAAQILDVLELDITAPLHWPPELAARVQLAATLLPSGDVLLTGGYAAYGEDAPPYPTETILFRPSYDQASGVEGAFVVGPSLSIGRTIHTATQLLDGRVLVAGGAQTTVPPVGRPVTDFFDSAEIFEEGSPGTFSNLGDGAMNNVRGAHTATLLTDGRVLLVGGLGNDFVATTSAEIFDPATNAFSPVGEMSEPRAFHTASIMADGRVLVAGGSVGWQTTFSNTTEIFDPSTAKFSPGPTMGRGALPMSLVSCLEAVCWSRADPPPAASRFSARSPLLSSS